MEEQPNTQPKQPDPGPMESSSKAGESAARSDETGAPDERLGTRAGEAAPAPAADSPEPAASSSAEPAATPSSPEPAATPSSPEPAAAPSSPEPAQAAAETSDAVASPGSANADGVAAGTPGEAPAAADSAADAGDGAGEGTEQRLQGQWGFVDAAGLIHQQGGKFYEGRVVGRLQGRSAQQALAFFEERFGQLAARVGELEQQFAAATNRGKFSERVARLQKMVRDADAIGDIDDLLGRLRAMEVAVTSYQQQQREAKQALCERAEALSTTRNWGRTAAELKKLQSEWKKLGSASREDDEKLWTRFRAAMDAFFKARDEDRVQRRQNQGAALEAKLKLCEQAEALAQSTDWAATIKEQERLLEEWKQAGWAGREDKQLWERFRAARGTFYERRQAARQSQRGKLSANRKAKEEICEAAEALLDSRDLKVACEEAKLLQRRWKEIGQVPRAASEPLWKRFRGACDELFSRAQKDRTRRVRQRSDSRERLYSRKRERAESLRESIARDTGHLERWQKALAGLGGAGAGLRKGLEEKVGAVERQLEEKRQALASLEAEIRGDQEG